MFLKHFNSSTALPMVSYIDFVAAVHLPDQFKPLQPEVDIPQAVVVTLRAEVAAVVVGHNQHPPLEVTGKRKVVEEVSLVPSEEAEAHRLKLDMTL